jgi:hypothetical protein
MILERRVNKPGEEAHGRVIAFFFYCENKKEKKTWKKR